MLNQNADAPHLCIFSHKNQIGILSSLRIAALTRHRNLNIDFARLRHRELKILRETIFGIVVECVTIFGINDSHHNL